MEERIRPTKSGLFAIELLAAVGIFTLCAALCMGIFVHAEVMSRDSGLLNRALQESQRAAECYKAAQGDLDRTASLWGADNAGDGISRDCGEGITVSILPEEAGNYAAAVLTARRENETLFTWRIAALEAEP